MNEGKWAETQTELRRLETLLPSLPPLASETLTSQYSYLTPEQLGEGRRRWLQWMIRRGWKFGDGGMLHRGKGREHMQTPPTGVAAPYRDPWDPMYNPRIDAPAAIR